MSVPAPHFLLYAEAALATDSDDCALARWRFVLRTPEGETTAEAADEETDASRERLELLAVIRGLEALDQPSRVTLMTGSRYLQCGLESGLVQWRENNWHWERYGRLTPIKNADLWRRLDRLTGIHSLACPAARPAHTDDLTPIQSIQRRTGRKLRIDQPAPQRAQASITSTKSQNQTSTKFQFPSKRNVGRLRRLNFGPWNCFGPWCLLIEMLNRAWSRIQKRSDHKHANSRGVSRANNRVARRHERPARRTSGPPA